MARVDWCDSNSTGGHAAPRGLVVAVVPVFRPDYEVLSNIRALAEQVDRLLVVDDGSPGDSAAILAELKIIPGVELIKLLQNVGIAEALNVGVRQGLMSGASAILTSDQDSLLAADYVMGMRQTHDEIVRQGKSVGVLAAGFQSGGIVRPVLYRDRGDNVTPTLEAIQSGMFIPAQTFQAVGEFDQRLFIDCVDSDFVLRCAALGLPTYLVRSCGISHSLGQTISVGGVRASRSGRDHFAFHPPWRRYYITRNRIMLLVRYTQRFPRWAAISTAGEGLQLLRSLVWGPAKGQQIAAVAIGILDALRGKSGKISNTVSHVLGA